VDAGEKAQLEAKIAETAQAGDFQAVAEMTENLPVLAEKIDKMTDRCASGAWLATQHGVVLQFFIHLPTCKLAAPAKCATVPHSPSHCSQHFCNRNQCQSRPLPNYHPEGCSSAMQSKLLFEHAQ
jgi:hypothetical protein